MTDADLLPELFLALCFGAAAAALALAVSGALP